MLIDLFLVILAEYTLNISMIELQFTKCHGSGNDFVLIDAIAAQAALEGVDLAALSRAACDRRTGIGSDGLLLLVGGGGRYGMRMFNPDGSEAGMCGNGIRCVARLAAEYIGCDEFVLTSGGRSYPVARHAPLAEGVETFGVELEVRTSSRCFAMPMSNGGFIARRIEALDDELRFTALDPGNPHIAAEVESIDLDRLKRLGEKAATLHDILPFGVNLSLYERRSQHRLFVATYERGAGITLSCGTAMTSAATAAVLTGRAERDRDIEVMNRGGMVVCRTHIADDKIVTTLTGNATFEWRGTLRYDGAAVEYAVNEKSGEQRHWEDFVDSIKDQL